MSFGAPAARKKRARKPWTLHDRDPEVRRAAAEELGKTQE